MNSLKDYLESFDADAHDAGRFMSSMMTSLAFSFLSDRECQCTGYAPAVLVNAALYSSSANAGNFFPFDMAKCLSVVSKESIIRFIPALLFISTPLRVARRIRAIVIYSVHGIAIRPLAHVVNKIPKAIKPALTDIDASPAVVLKRGVVFVITSTYHVFVDDIQRIARFYVRVFSAFIIKAAARFAVLANNLMNFKNPGFPALATKKPFTKTIANWFNCCPVMEGVSWAYIYIGFLGSSTATRFYSAINDLAGSYCFDSSAIALENPASAFFRFLNRSQRVELFAGGRMIFARLLCSHNSTSCQVSCGEVPEKRSNASLVPLIIQRFA